MAECPNEQGLLEKLEKGDEIKKIGRYAIWKTKSGEVVASSFVPGGTTRFGYVQARSKSYRIRQDGTIIDEQIPLPTSAPQDLIDALRKFDKDLADRVAEKSKNKYPYF